MKKHRMPEMKEGGVNVTPLIDVVMCMIIFFMLVAKIGVSTGADSSIQIPETILGGKIEDMGNALTLNIRRGGDDQPMITALIGGEMKELSAAGNAGGKLPLVGVLRELRQKNSEFKVVIRGDKDMPYRYLEPVLSACTQANVANVDFNTKQAQ